MDNEGEGNKITQVPPITKPDNITSKAEQKFPPQYKEKVEVKQPSGWQKKFLGIPVWGWITIAGVLVWAGIIVGIVMYR